MLKWPKILIYTLLKDWKKMSKLTKFLAPLLFLISILITASCVSVGPSPEYVNRQHENAKALFPIMHRMLDEIKDNELSEISGLNTKDKEIINYYRESLKTRIDSWLYLIEKEKELVGGQK